MYDPDITMDHEGKPKTLSESWIATGPRWMLTPKCFTGHIAEIIYGGKAARVSTFP